MLVNFLNIAGVQKCTRQAMEDIMEQALDKVNFPFESEINVAFVTPEEIKQINNKQRAKNVETDVLSFPAFQFKAGDYTGLDKDEISLNINPETQRFCLGDMLLCLDVAKVQAKKLGHTLKTELVRLSLHSVLHCLGYDHIKDEDYDVMHKMEMQIMKENGYKVEE